MPTQLRKLNTLWKPYYLFILTCLHKLIMLTQAPWGDTSKSDTPLDTKSVPKTLIRLGTRCEVTPTKDGKNKVAEKTSRQQRSLKKLMRYEVLRERQLSARRLAHDPEQDEPIIVFYLKAGRRIDSIAHTRGKWFQTQVTKPRDKDWGWWLFTHFEKYLNRDEVSKRDSTQDFQNELRDLLSGDALQLLLFKTDRYESEPRAIAELDAVADFGFLYHATTNRNLPTLGEADILWLGYRSLSEGRYRLNKEQEKRIKEFVKSGGIVIASGQDSDDDRPCGSGWLPEPLNGVESQTRNDFKVTSHAGELFKSPNRIRSGQLSLTLLERRIRSMKYSQQRQWKRIVVLNSDMERDVSRHESPQSRSSQC